MPLSRMTRDAPTLVIPCEPRKSNVAAAATVQIGCNGRHNEQEGKYPRDDSNVRHTAPEAVALSGLSYGGT